MSTARLLAALATTLTLIPCPAATAAPLPRARAAIPAPATPAASALRSGRASAGLPRGIESVCGTQAETGIDLLAAHAARELQSPLPTPHSTDVGPIAVLEDDGTFFYTTTGGQTVADLAAIGQAFYRTHGDDYDCLAVFLSTGLTTWLGSYSALAAAYLLRNDIQGIGLDAFDIGASVGSPSRLQWMLSMNGLLKYPYDPAADIGPGTYSYSTLDVFGHEFAHRWCSWTWVDSAGTPSHVLLGRQLAHWSFYLNSHASLMEGCDWVSPAPDSFQVNALTERYSDLDLYLMGLKPAAQVDSFFTLHDATDFDPPGDYTPATWPVLGTSCDARQHWWHLSDIQAVNGPRIPDAASAPHQVRLGLILVTPRGSDASQADLDKVARIRNQFLPYFATLTEGLETLDISLDSRAGSVRIQHDPVHDQLDFDAPIPVTARIDIAQAGIPLALDPSSLTLNWRIGTSGPFATIPLSAAGPDTFTASLPASPGTLGPVQYWLHAASDSTGIEADDPPAGPAAPHEFEVGPDLTPPVIVHTPVRARGADQMPMTLIARVTDNAALDSVWVEWTLEGSPPVSTPFASVGHDSFEVAIGAGALEGQRLDYQIGALDGSDNFTWHRSELNGGQPWSFVVGRDDWFDADNGPQAMTHESGWTTYRDAWHLTQEDASPAGGTAWKCGADAPLAYPVHLDSDLMTPWLPVIEPGTVLRFAHRYELEEANASLAWDGARIEGQVGAGPWQILDPQVPYSHGFLVDSPPFVPGTPCWSGSSGGWRTEAVDLSPLAPGPARVRFRMLADDFVGYDGWIVDSIDVDRPGDVSAVAATRFAARPPWPNPADDRIHLQCSLARAGEVEWSLYDLAGRRVASLTRAFAAGPALLDAPLPPGLRPGIYLSRLRVPGAPARVDRIAVLR